MVNSAVFSKHLFWVKLAKKCDCQFFSIPKCFICPRKSAPNPARFKTILKWKREGPGLTGSWDLKRMLAWDFKRMLRGILSECCERAKIFSTHHKPLICGPEAQALFVNCRNSNRTVARKFLIGGLCVCAGGLDFLNIDKNYTDL